MEKNGRTDEDQTYITALADTCRRDLVGGKAFILSQLVRKGVTVPEGFCITTRAYDFYICHNKIADVTPEKIRKGEMPPLLAETLLRAYNHYIKGSCAVRSSSPLEDLKRVSFAGQYRSFLNITENTFLEAVKECWASLWEAPAVNYRKKMGIKDENAKMAVLVLEMVPAEASGVLFTQDLLTIEAVFGLGDLLVGGRVIPDQYGVERSTLTITERKISTKTVMSVINSEGGVKNVAVSEEKKDLPVLDDNHIRELCILGKKVEDLFGCPQDIEWALNNTTLFVLQARPITGTPVIWSRANAAETHPGYVTYLSRPPENKPDDILLALLPLFESFGIKNVPEDLKLTGFIYGHVYLNMSVAQDILSQIPGLSPDVLYQSLGHTAEGSPSPVTSPAQSSAQSQPPAPSLSMLKLSSLIKLLPGTVRVIKFFLNLPKRAQVVAPYALELIDDIYHKDLRELSLEDLDSLVWDMYDRKSQLFQVHACTALAAMSLFGLVQKLVARVGEEGMENILTVGLEGMSSSQLGIEMWKLAQKASTSGKVCELVLSRSVNALEELRTFEEGITFLKDFDEFMELYGDRCSQESDLSVLRWREDPAFVLSVVASHVQSHADPVTIIQEQKETRLEAKIKLLKKMRNPFMKMLFTKILEKTEEYIVTRENLKTVWVKSIFALRLLYLAIAEKLVETHALRERDDIFYLKMTEVSDIIKGYQGREDIYTVIPERKKEQELCENLEVPEVVIGKPPSPEELTCTVELKNLLEGVGCSPGVVRGKARVGSSPGECTELEEGEILVAPVTDPGWSPLFVTAGGLVMELGGTLSHGVIIAREYGIPAVAGVKNATKVIETGQIITVDGNKGVVYIE